MHGNDRFMTIVGAVVLVLVLGSAFVFGANNPDSTPPRPPGDYIGDLETKKETIPGSGELIVGANETIVITQGTKIIKNLTAKLTWVDETQRPGMPRLRRYQNMPDTFTMTVNVPMGNATKEGSGTNAQGGEGTIELSVSFPPNELNAAIHAALDAGTQLPDWNVEVVLTDAGDWRTVLPPHLIGFRDDANSYILEIAFEYYDLSEIMA